MNEKDVNKILEQANLDGYTEQTESVYEKFEKHGDLVKGLLISKKLMTEYDSHKYTIKQMDGKTVKFLATTQLEELLTNIEIGKELAIMYVSDRITEKGDQKIFRLWVK